MFSSSSTSTSSTSTSTSTSTSIITTAMYCYYYRGAHLPRDGHGHARGAPGAVRGRAVKS